jgi:hypothetical protein
MVSLHACTCLPSRVLARYVDGGAPYLDRSEEKLPVLDNLRFTAQHHTTLCCKARLAVFYKLKMNLK